ncbi:hypothetical protein [Roseobacter weihaiensis]|uniref:hypothetical protein n=1 Tax=Roseobacter weihaiensis TaxID=2763262 RepID=UPI001D0AD58C|nr:hypothetical protein [Roseobacter sp. H9]
MKWISPFVAAVFFAAPASAEIKADYVTVKADVAVLEALEAGTIWTELPEDLHARIIERLTEKGRGAGTRIDIEIDTATLARDVSHAVQVTDSRFIADVKIAPPRRYYGMDYTLIILGGGTVGTALEQEESRALSLHSEAHYNSMLDKFTDNIVSKLAW